MSRNRPPFSRAALLETLQSWPEPRSYCVALSGGADSTALLLALSKGGCALPLRALHINHGLHPEAGDWAEHCRQLCQSIDIPLSVEDVSVEKHEAGPEAAARQARREVFAEQLGAGEALLTGHHADDQAETLLLNALRGSGVDGLAGIPAMGEFSRGYLIRPLLGWTRAELQSWLERQSVKWVEDSSNRNTDIPRNFLRHEILPRLETHWSEPQLRLARSASLSRQVSDWQRDWAARKLDETSSPLHWSELATLNPIQQQTLVREWLRQNGFRVPNKARLEEALQQFRQACEDARILIEWNGAQLRFWQQRIYVHAPLQPHGGNWPVTWSTPTQTLPDQMGTLRLTTVSGQPAESDWLNQQQLQLHYRQGGERLRAHPEAHSSPLKHWFQQHAIPPWLRDRMPLIQRQNQIVAVADRWLSRSFEQALKSRGLALSWQPGESFASGSA